MATYKTEGLVLRRHNLGEADRIVSLFTSDHGKVRAVAKGVRRPKSRLAGHLEPFSVTELMLAEGRNLDVITSARLLRYFNNLTLDYDALMLGYLMNEMLERLLPDEESHPDIYALLVEAYDQLENAALPSVIELYFKLRLLDNLGYRPRLDACVVCGHGDPDTRYFLNPELGGIVDQSCAMAGLTQISLNEIKLWRLILGKPLSEVQAIGGVGQLASESRAACDQFYDYIFGRRFRTAEMRTEDRV